MFPTGSGFSSDLLIGCVCVGVCVWVCAGVLLGVCITGRVYLTGCYYGAAIPLTLLLCFDYQIFDKPSKYEHYDTRQSLQSRLL